MAIKSYNKLYLTDVSENVGAMFEYAKRWGYESQYFWNLFINSPVALGINNGNLKYLSGCSGKDYILDILKENIKNDDIPLTYNEYYWAGWALAHLQYETNYSFYEINERLPIERVMELYDTLHEADISKFIDIGQSYLEDKKYETHLKTIRVASGLSQRDLAEASNVDIRSIQMYEQRRNEINKAQVETLAKLAKVLGCQIENLIEH